MAYDADGNFYNPYEPGTFEYDYEESQRSQPVVELTPEQQAREIASYQQYQNFLASNPEYVANAQAIAQRYIQESGGSDKWLNSVLPAAIAVASIVVPGIGTALGSAILGGSAASVGAAIGLTAAEVSAAIGAATISAATTAASGGTVEDVIRNAAGAGVSVGLNFGMGGGVSGAVAGSTAGTIVRGGDASQVVTNAFAAGVGAGVQGAMTENPDAGKIVGSAARTYISTGGNVDQTLLSATLTGLGTLDKSTASTSARPTTSTSQPVGQPFNYAGVTYQELEDGTAQATPASGNPRIISAETLNELKEDYARDLSSGAITPSSVTATLQPVSVIGTAQLQDTTYNLLSNGGAEYVDDRGTKRTLSPQEWVVEQSQLGGTVAPTLAPVSVTATTLPPSLDTQILSLMNATAAPTLPPVAVSATTELPTLSPTLPVPTLPGVTIAATSELPTLPPWWDQMTAGPTLPPVQITATTELPTLSPTLPPVTVTETTGLPTLSPTLPPVVITETTGIPTLPPVVVTETTGIPTLSPTLSPVTIVPTTEPPTSPPTLPPETTPPVTTLPPATTAPPTSKPTSRPTKEPTYPVVISVTPEPRPRAPSTITGVSPARLLADALAAYRPAGAIEGEESGKERQNVWNEKSLRLKDALGL
jgi:hypothetical protein